MLETTFSVADTPENLSVLYENMYFAGGRLLFVTLDPDANPPTVNKWNIAHPWRPEVKIFGTQEYLDAFLAQFEFEEVELGLNGDFLWYDDIGHGLFDGLYPSYLALVKFGFEHMPFTLCANELEKRHRKIYEAVSTFTKTDEIIEWTKVDPTRVS